ncbi:MAG: hypothetical protein WCX64_03230 [Candidatus Micrarchaeia archaeon]
MLDPNYFNQLVINPDPAWVAIALGVLSAIFLAIGKRIVSVQRDETDDFDAYFEGFYFFIIYIPLPFLIAMGIATNISIKYDILITSYWPVFLSLTLFVILVYLWNRRAVQVTTGRLTQNNESKTATKRLVEWLLKPKPTTIILVGGGSLINSFLLVEAYNSNAPESLLIFPLASLGFLLCLSIIIDIYAYTQSRNILTKVTLTNGRTIVGRLVKRKATQIQQNNTLVTIKPDKILCITENINKDELPEEVKFEEQNKQINDKMKKNNQRSNKK